MWTGLQANTTVLVSSAQLRGKAMGRLKSANLGDSEHSLSHPRAFLYIQQKDLSQAEN